MKTLRIPDVMSQLQRRIPRRLLYWGTALLIVLIAVHLYERPAHHYNTAYEGCWEQAVRSLLADNPLPPPSHSCDAPSGTLLGVGKLDRTEPITSSKDHAEVIFATGEGADFAGLAYVAGYPPPQDTCVTPLGGPWWEFRSGGGTGNCPRGYRYQGGG